MVEITEDEIRELAAFRGDEAPVTSCYLDVDGRRMVRRQDYERTLDGLVRDARTRVGPDLAAHRSVTDDLRRMQEYVHASVDRSGVRGVAMFSCSAHGFWRTYELPVPIRNQLVVNAGPAVSQLEVVLHEYEPIGVLLADRQRARMFVFALGKLVECREEFEQLPRQDDVGGLLTRDQVHDRTAELAHHHLRHAARVAFEVWQRNGFAHLVIGAPEEIAGQLERDLHPYLRERLAHRLSVPVTASHEEVRVATLEAEVQLERAREQQAVDRLREAVGAGRRGVAGLKPTLQALGERRVDTLLVSHGYTAAGWRCDACEHLTAVGRACPVCGGDMSEVPDVVEEAVEAALLQKCRVETCVGNADLDVLGRVGALLRY